MSRTKREEPAAAACGCGLNMEADGRKAVGVDPETKVSNVNRLRRIEGQVRGIQKMVEEDRYCPDIMMQLSAVQEALRTVGRALMRNHLKHCTTHTVLHGSPGEAEAMYDELLNLIYKHSR
jgi:CsoR family transcriptional regulator, copper-sensing transcriptional repressor